MKPIQYEKQMRANVRRKPARHALLVYLNAQYRLAMRGVSKHYITSRLATYDDRGDIFQPDAVAPCWLSTDNRQESRRASEHTGNAKMI